MICVLIIRLLGLNVFLFKFKSKYIEYNGNKFKYLGNGCKATGANMGWRMSEDLYFRCINCGYLMSGDMHQDDRCLCGKLTKDSGFGRFGSSYGDDAIEVYKRV